MTWAAEVATPAEPANHSHQARARVPSLLLDLAAGRDPRTAVIDDHVVRLANEHRLTGLLWTWARDHVTDAALKTELAQNDLYVQAHLVRVWNVLEEAVARLTAVGIEIATIKGVTAEARWYGRRGERPCSDVDLMMSPLQLDRAAEAVRLLEPDHPWQPYVGALAAVGRIQTVTTHLDGIEVDLHFDMLKLGIQTRQRRVVWDLTYPFPLSSGGSVRVLDDTTALIHFLVHLNKDRFQRLLGFADIQRIITAGQVDWDRLVWFCRQEGLTVPVLRSLEVVLDELLRPWPAEVPRPRGPRARAWNLIWPQRIRLRGIEGRLRFRRRQDWLAFLARGRSWEAVRWWFRDLWPPAAVVAVRYADIRGPYLWKLVRGRIATAKALRAALAERARN